MTAKKIRREDVWETAGKYLKRKGDTCSDLMVHQSLEFNGFRCTLAEVTKHLNRLCKTHGWVGEQFKNENGLVYNVYNSGR